MNTKRNQPDDRLFIGVWSTGIGYADRSRERHGDYAPCAFLPFDTLALKFESDCPRDLRGEIERHAAKIQARRGETYPIDSAGHTVILGRDVRPNYFGREAPRHHRVADFNTLDALIAHARDELGATHVLMALKSGTGDLSDNAGIFFPVDGRYERARVWRKGSYWHSEGPGSRERVSRLPAHAIPIDEYLTRGGRTERHPRRHAAGETSREASRTRSRKGEARKYWIVEQVQKGLWYQVGYFHAKGEAERFARTVPGRTRIVHTWSGHNHPIAR